MYTNEQVRQAFEKVAFIGAGISVLSSKNRNHHLTVGFPYGVGYSYAPMQGVLSPSVGVGLTGPNIGIMYKGKKKEVKEVKKEQNKKETKETKKEKLNKRAFKEIGPIGEGLKVVKQLAKKPTMHDAVGTTDDLVNALGINPKKIGDIILNRNKKKYIKPVLFKGHRISGR